MTDEAVAIARLEAQMNYLLQDWKSVKVVLLERSGDVAKMGQFERDLNGLGEKVRTGELELVTMGHRIDAFEQRRAREAGIVVGVLAALQALWALGGDAIKHVLFGGGR